MDRRTFSKLALASLVTRRMPASPAPRPVGIQLYTVRSVMEKDPGRTLDALAAIGYQEVELAGTAGKSAREFRALLDGAGLKAPSGHIAIEAFRKDMGKALDDAAVLGHHWATVPWIDEGERTIEGLTKLTDLFNRIGEAAQQRGMRAAYHNHDFEFKPIGDVLPYDLLLEKTDPDLVDFEVDLFWIRNGGKDPLDYFARYPGRFAMLHVKDMSADGKMVDVGQGVIPFANIFEHSSEAGVQHYFVEHDQPPQPLEDARISYNSLNRLLNP